MLRPALVEILSLALLTVWLSFTAIAQSPDIAEPGSVEAIAAATTDPHYVSPWVSYIPQSPTVPSPEKFLGRIMGASGQLLGTEKSYAYARALAAASPRVRLFTIGHSEEGREIVILAIADEAGIRDLDRLKAATAALADPRRTDQAAADKLIATARLHNPDALADPGIRDRIARLWSQLELTRLLNARALSKILKGQPNWPEVPLAKLQWSSLSQTIAELGVDILGPMGVLSRGGPDAVDKGHWSHNYIWQRYTSIGAGTTEVQKNIIADRAIKMPRR